jgi:rare lipoprotein A
MEYFMKRLLYTFMILTFFVSGCAREKDYVKPPRPETIVLPETEKGRPPKPYVVNGKRYYPLPESRGFSQVGQASWYGEPFHGRPTASGEIFDMHKKTAAHKTLPLGTYVKVVNLTNKKSTLVRINDRGPFVKGRIIDLSYASGRDIDLIGPGVVDVRIIAYGREVGRLKSTGGSRPLVEVRDLERGEFTVQVGAFEEQENALRLADRLRILFEYVHVTLYEDESRRTLYRVQVSKSKTMAQAGEIETRLEKMGFTGAFVVRI